MGPSAERGGRGGAVGVAQPGEEERPAERGGDVVPEESQRPDASRAAQDRQRQANAVGEPHEEHDAGVVVVAQPPGPRDGRLPAGRETRQQRGAVAAAQREVDLVSGDRRDAGHEGDRPPRPVALCCERAADDDGRLSLEPGPDEQHRTTVAVDDRAEVHGLKNTRAANLRSEEHTSELQSLAYLVCRLLLEKKKINKYTPLVECE